jgi:hypothetical protein
VCQPALHRLSAKRYPRVGRTGQARYAGHAILGNVRVRNPKPDEPDDSEPGPEDEYAAEPEVTAGRVEPDGSVTFRVSPGVIGVKFAVAAGLAVIALIRGIGPEFVIGIVVAVAVAVYGLRDLLGRDRLRADPSGLKIGTGFGAQRTLAWTDVERLRVDQRSRLGARSELLEIDAGDELYLLSRFDLGADPSDALVVLEALRSV